jgi:His/Glu/Gln/Arg/opine family amino acid ABC transporter permease subunit
MLAFVSEVFALVVGLVFSVLKRKRIPVVSQILAVCISYFRAVPTLVQLFVAFYAIPRVLTSLFPDSAVIANIPNVVYAILTLGLNHASYASEIFRAAFDSVDAGQTEAAYSLNMTRWQALRHIILPQAFVVALPNLTSLFLGLIQETSLASIVGVREITMTGIQLADIGYDFLESYIMLTLIYEVLSFIIGRAMRLIESRVGSFRRGGLEKPKSRFLRLREKQADAV